MLLERNIFRRNNIERITGYYPSAVKIFNQSYRVTCRDNLVIEHPYSNGIWYDVGNVDGVFVNNWVENALDGFFFEISKGAIVAGNVFVNCDKGIRALNARTCSAYQNTFVNSVASFERTPRSAVGDHFGWHPATGPDVDARHGHVFVGNLLVANEGFQRPLLNVEQSPALCGKLTDSPLARIDGNVYVRRGDASARPFITWSPAAGQACTVQLAAPADLTALHPGFEAHGRARERLRGRASSSAPSCATTKLAGRAARHRDRGPRARGRAEGGRLAARRGSTARGLSSPPPRRVVACSLMWNEPCHVMESSAEVR